jgi:Flp pilus assembly protein TadG
VRARLKHEEGANAVEFALVLPILVVLLFGILYGGLVINHQLSVTQAAREGARFGATAPWGDDWFTDVRTRAVQASAGTLSVSSAAICVWFVTEDGDVEPDPSNSGCPTGLLNELPDDGDRVVVYVERTAVIDLVMYRLPPTKLKGYAVARHEAGLPSGGG